MSDVFQLSEFDHLDQDTKSIVNGYILEASRLIDRQIPDIIHVMILMKVDDHFMFNRGSYQWHISGVQQIQRLLSAQPDSTFNSDLFEISGIQCMIMLCPNGYSNGPISAGNVGLYVKLLSFPKSWKYILVHQTLICKQTNTVSHEIGKYRKAAAS